MKNLSYIVITASTLFFASCATEPQGPSQTEIDAQVEAKVKAATEQLKAECDSRILGAAQLKKDSILVKAGQQKPVVATPAPKPTPTPKAPPVKTKHPEVKEPVKETPKPTVGNGKPKMGGQNTTEVGNGKPKMGGNKNEQGKVEETKIGNGKPKMGGQ